MANVFTKVKRGCGIASVVVTGGYIIALIMAISDGAGVGVEIPRPLDVLSIMTIVCTTVTAAGAWLAEQSSRISAEQYVRPIVRHELDKAFAEAMPLFVATVTEAVNHRAYTAAEMLTERLGGQLHAVAAQAARQTAARMREAHTADLSEICSELHQKTLIAGQIMQANATGEELGKRALRSIKTYVGTSQGD